MVMASAGVNNMPAGPGAGADAADHASECRLRRRRRLAPPHPIASTSAGSDESAAAAAAGTPHSSESSEDDLDDSAAAINLVSSAAGLPADAGAAAVWPVAFGSVALAGRLREMEDTVSLHPSFCVWADGSPMHFFAVFDGHGGAHVRNHLTSCSVFYEGIRCGRKYLLHFVLPCIQYLRPVHPQFQFHTSSICRSRVNKICGSTIGWND